MDIRKTKLWAVVSNPYLLAITFFLVWMVFFDSNGYMGKQQQDEQIRELEEQQAFYQKEIDRLNEELEAIEQDPEELEKFAREQFMYKEKGEEIFVLEKE